MSNLKDDLLGLKSKLESLEKNFEYKLKDVEDKESKFRKIEDQINQLVSNKDTVIKLNVGGKVFQTKMSTLLSKQDSLFYKLISSNVDGDDISKLQNRTFFFDRSYQNFPFILDYLRTNKFTLKGLGKYELEDIQAECEYYGIHEVNEQILDLQKEIEFVSFEGAPRYSSAGTHKLEDLKDRSLMKGICVQSPYHIIIELNFEHEIEAMEIGGWNGNTGIWYPGNGASSTISTSVDKSTWKQVGTIPSNYGAVIQTVQLTPSVAKYVKFQGTSYLGIGFLNLIRRK